MLSIKHSFVFSLFAVLIQMAQAQSDPTLPPANIAIGDQFYCPGEKIPVVIDFDIQIADEDLTAYYIQISSGYRIGSDFLELSQDQPNISAVFNRSTGKLTLNSKSGSILSLDEIIAAVKDVVFYSTDPNIIGEKYFSFTQGQANFLPSTGHFYEYVRSEGISWLAARAAAAQREYYGLPGYLATITSREEAQLSGEQAEGTGWIGASDFEVEGTWKWVTGPEAGTVFWIGDFNGSAQNGEFEFWNDFEPNNLGNEDYAHVTAPNIGVRGSWNDLPVEGSTGDYAPRGYIVEYGYGGPDDAPIFSAFTRVYTNPIDSLFSNNRCGPGEIELRATIEQYEDQEGITEVLWFDSVDSESPLFTGEIYKPTIAVDTEYYVLASQGGCYSGQRKRVMARIYPDPDIEEEVTLKNCDADDIPNDGYTDFNLQEADDLINKGDFSLTITYHLTEDDATQDINRIDPPYFNNRISDAVFARAESLDGCFDLSIVNLLVSATDPLDIIVPLESCDDDGTNDGFYTFDLTDASVIILEELPQQDLIIEYYRNQEDAALKINEIQPQSQYTNEVPFGQNLYARIESLVNGECVSVGEYVQLKVNPLPEFEVPAEETLCTNIGDLELAVSNAQGNYSYLWKDENGTTISTESRAIITSAGNYTVVAQDGLGCVSEVRSVAIRESSIADITEDDIQVVDGEVVNSIIIDPTGLGIGTYEYALDSEFGPYQDEPIFEGVLPGIHTVYVRDKNGCGIDNIEVSVIGYPKFFTPNGDGYNDTWQVLGVSFQPMSDIFIYDKFGKLLTQLDGNSEGWDGVFNGKLLPSADYWYRVQLEDGRIHTGHFSLIRR